MKAKTREELLAMYDRVGLPTKEGLVRVCKNGKYFHIHLDGTRAYPEEYDHAEDFYEGLALVRQGNNWDKIYPDGTVANQ